MQTLRSILHERIAALILAAALSVLLLLAATGYASGAGSREHAIVRRRARAAATETLNEQMRMHITSVKGKRISGEGSASGTVAGSVSFNLVLTTGSRGSAEFSGRNSHGTIEATGAASYRVSGPVSYYTGSVTSITGTGKYAHAHSLGLTFSGTLNRRTYEVIFQLHGKWRV
jgi:hypothetical protein